MTEYEKLSLKIQLATLTTTVSALALSIESTKADKIDALTQLNETASEIIKEVVEALT